MKFDKLIQPYPSFSEDYASVAILIIDDKELLFIKRSENLPTHKGHIAFPGGKKENSDKNIVETALREAEEELFIEQSSIKPLGSLNHVDTVEYAFKVFPIICETSDKPDRFNENEVQDIYFLKIEDLENSVLKIFNNPEKYFTKEILKQLDEACVKEFKYGDVIDTEIPDTAQNDQS